VNINLDFYLSMTRSHMDFTSFLKLESSGLHL